MLKILFPLMTTFATMTLIMSSPVSLAITILMMSLCVAMIMASFMSSWVAFLMFLIYIGGMLIMFAYFVATAPNMPINIKLMTTTSALTFMGLFLLTTPKSMPFKPMHTLMLNTFYTPETFNTLILLALVLLLTMVIVVKLVNMQKGPLRPFK